MAGKSAPARVTFPEPTPARFDQSLLSCRRKTQASASRNQSTGRRLWEQLLAGVDDQSSESALLEVIVQQGYMRRCALSWKQANETVPSTMALGRLPFRKSVRMLCARMHGHVAAAGCAP